MSKKGCDDMLNIIKEKQKSKIESNHRIFRLYNKQQVNKSLKHINDEIDEAVEEFYKTKKRQRKRRWLIIRLSSLIYLLELQLDSAIRHLLLSSSNYLCSCWIFNIPIY